MKKSEFFSGINIGIKWSLVGLFPSIILSFLVLFIPTAYNFTFGENRINDFVEKIPIDKTNPDEVSIYLLSWINKNVHYPTKEEIVWNPFIYRIDNKTRFWVRSNHASWFLLNKLGRCGEDAYFYVEMMNELNYTARVIKPRNWDHAWAEYYSDGYWIALDPSANKIIPDRIKHVGERNVTKVTAKYFNGSIEDVSSLYGIRIN